jgi:hypothetical protein
MKQPTNKYTVLLLFGKEADRSVAAPASFADLTERIARLLEPAGCNISARGTIQTPKLKNVAPRRGAWSGALRDRFLESLRSGHFLDVELFDARWSNTRDPDVYASIHKYWDLGPGLAERTAVGAENSLTLAIRQDLLPDPLQWMKDAARELLQPIDGFYGTIESDVPWAQRLGDGVYDDVIDVRWHYRANNDYGNGTHRMERGVARLARGNILCRTQLTRRDLNALRELPLVARVEEWPRRLTYVELKRQPKYRSTPPPPFADYIRFLPET